MTITEEMAAIKAACTHAWAPWLGKAACCAKCGLLCHFLPKPRKALPAKAKVRRIRVDTRRRRQAVRKPSRFSRALAAVRAVNVARLGGA